MKIDVVGPVYPYRGGIAHYTTMMVKYLQSAGHDVKVYSFRRQYPAWLYPGQTDRDNSRNRLETKADYPLDPFYPWTWAQTAQRILADKPDLVVIAWWTTFWALPFMILTRLLRWKGLKVVYLIHNVMPHEARFFDRWLVRQALLPANQYVVQTEKEAGRLRALISSANLTIVPHPVYEMFAEKTVTREAARLRLNLAEDAQVLLFFGIVRPYKGLRYLIEALSILKKKGINAHLVVAGEFWQPEAAFHTLAAHLGVGDRVVFDNRYITNEELPLYFNGADAFVAPYINGTQSGAVKMAMGFGMPIVLTRCIADELLTGQANVWVSEEGNSESLSNAIQHALVDGKRIAPESADSSWLRVVQALEKLA